MPQGTNSDVRKHLSIYSCEVNKHRTPEDFTSKSIHRSKAIDNIIHEMR